VGVLNIGLIFKPTTTKKLGHGSTFQLQSLTSGLIENPHAAIPTWGNSSPIEPYLINTLTPILSNFQYVKELLGFTIAVL
jgi:hypothetical protein